MPDLMQHVGPRLKSTAPALTQVPHYVIISLLSDSMCDVTACVCLLSDLRHHIINIICCLHGQTANCFIRSNSQRHLFVQKTIETEGGYPRQF